MKERLIKKLQDLKKKGILNWKEIEILSEKNNSILFSLDGYILQYEESDRIWLERLVDCDDNKPLTIEEVGLEGIEHNCWTLL